MTGLPDLIAELGIIPLTLYYLVARAFYARHDTWTPVLVGLIGVGACVLCGWLLMKPMGVPGLALAIALLALNFLGDGMRDALDPR